uniref:Uncharacterized protein n=1 Tax=Oryza brachyantha TaxID=4533 RepID=J3N1S2_ORYBR
MKRGSFVRENLTGTKKEEQDAKKLQNAVSPDCKEAQQISAAIAQRLQRHSYGEAANKYAAHPWRIIVGGGTSDVSLAGRRLTVGRRWESRDGVAALIRIDATAVGSVCQ